MRHAYQLICSRRRKVLTRSANAVVSTLAAAPAVWEYPACRLESVEQAVETMQESTNCVSTTMDVHSLGSRASALFEKRFAAVPEVVIAAPGRVNLIGEHTDYSDGFVLPMAIERYVAIAAKVRHERQPPTLRVYSAEVDESTEIELARRPSPGEPRWANYVRGVVAGFLELGHPLPSLDVVLVSTVPLGSGLSSSAALEVATATLLETVLGITVDPVEKALLCQKAEHQFAGVPCGLMDQMASIMGRATGAVLIDCRAKTAKVVPLENPGASVLICNSRVRHSLADGEYGRRRADCERASQLLGVKNLRDCDLLAVDAAKNHLGAPIYQRAKHVVTENARTLQFAEALRLGDLKRAGELMYESHASLQHDFEVSCPELDVLVKEAQAIGLRGGVFGSRMTGGGFGGCTVSLVATDQVSEIQSILALRYLSQTGRQMDAFVTRPSEGLTLRSVAHR